MKQYILIFVMCLGALGVQAQEMKTLFTNMPDSLIPQLESAWRKDLIDLYNTGKEARLQNTMNGFAKLLKLTSDYVLLQPTERTTVELKSLPLVNNTYIICMITTIDGPVADSRVAFYTTDWKSLESENLLTPVTGSWFVKDGADKNSDAYQDALARLDMDLIKYQLSPDNQNLTATYTTPQYLSENERSKVLPFLKDNPRIYTWEKSYFK
ncbi:hypothetical protein FACS189411_08950 [Bacteroidia bacterium]|nr:hypothetical protein FACS189411_08950 [Bacteroidia bacterium]